MHGVASALIGPLLALCIGSGCGERPPDALDERPSAILYLVDTLRADALGAYGNRTAATPHLDRFARGSTLFENAFANSSWTRASVGSLLTGRYPGNHGAQARHSALPDGVETLAEMLSSHGYATAFLSTNPNVAACFGFGQGFDDMWELYDRKEPGEVEGDELITPSDRVTRAAIEWIGAARRPFFLVLHTIDPHDPYAPPGRFDRHAAESSSRVDGDPGNFLRLRLDPLDRRRIRSLYDGEVSFNDDSFGAFLAYLDESGLAANTLVVVTADHGEEFWEYGPERRGHALALSDLQLRVPLLVRFPSSGHVAPGRRETRAVQLVDVVPTFLDLLELPPAEGIDGTSLFAADAGDLPIYASLQLDSRSMQAVIRYPYKLVWDQRLDRYDLYRLGAADADGRPPDWRAVRGDARIRGQLRALLDAHVARSRQSAGDAVAQDAGGVEVPPRVHDALRALGYVDP
jgi:arylsulfatase A-like enzyme